MLSRSCGVLVGDRLRAHGVLTACPRRAHRVLGAVTARARRAHGIHAAGRRADSVRTQLWCDRPFTEGLAWQLVDPICRETRRTCRVAHGEN